MRAELYWIPLDRWRLAILPRPRGGDYLTDEILSLRGQGVDVLVSLLTVDEQDELDLGDEAMTCADCSLEYISFPVADRTVPGSRSGVVRLVDHLQLLLSGGKGVEIHCRAGIGRSGIIASACLMRLGLSAEAALESVSAARGCDVPDTSEQRD